MYAYIYTHALMYIYIDTYSNLIRLKKKSFRLNGYKYFRKEGYKREYTVTAIVIGTLKYWNIHSSSLPKSDRLIIINRHYDGQQ